MARPAWLPPITTTSRSSSPAALAMEGDSRQQCAGEDAGGDKVDGGAERWPPARVPDEVGAVLPQVLQAVAGQPEHEQPCRSADTHRGHDYEGSGHDALDGDDVPSPIGHAEPDVDGRDDGNPERIDGLGRQPPEGERRHRLEDAGGSAADNRSAQGTQPFSRASSAGVLGLGGGDAGHRWLLYVRLLPGRYEPAGRRRTGRIARFTGQGGRSRRGRSAELERGEFGARAEAELAEHIAQVEVDGAGAEEQLCGGVPVGQALPNERGDLPFLGGELCRGGDVAAAGGLAGGA